MMTRYYSFEEFVEYGKRQEGVNIVDGMPWSFDFFGVPVTQEDDEKYIIGNSSVFFEKGDFLAARVLGDVGIVKGGWIIPQNDIK